MRLVSIAAVFQHQPHHALRLVLGGLSHELPHPPGLPDIPYAVVVDEPADEDRQARRAVLSPGKKAAADVDELFPRVQREARVQGETGEELLRHLRRPVAGREHHRL